jgi:hypothetical protein
VAAPTDLVPSGYRTADSEVFVAHPVRYDVGDHFCLTRCHVDDTEVLAKATIVAALIASHAVEIPRIPAGSGDHMSDPAAIRLRDLTAYVYEAIVRGGR